MNEEHITPEPTTNTRKPTAGVSGIVFAVLIILAGYFLWSGTSRGTERTSTSFIGPVKPDAASVTAVTDVPAANAAAGAPQLASDKDKIDLGDIKLGKTVKVDFQLSNAGGRPLQIKELPYVEVVQGCCPPQAAIGSMTLNPGQTTQLSMQFMMHEGMGGKHLFRIHVKTNDPKRPDRTLEVTSNWIS